MSGEWSPETTRHSRVLAVDVGGTRLKGAVVDGEYRVVRELVRATPRTGVIDAVVELAAELGGEVVAAGVVVPGIVDEQTGTAVLSTNLGWRDVPLRAELSSRLAIPVGFGHDVRAGGLAEARLGAAAGAATALFVPIGTGIGAAVLVDGVPVPGAGEIGHLPVDPAGVACACGQRGCLETIASAAAIVRRYTEQTGIAVDSAAEAADHQVWTDAIEALATVLLACVTLLAPEVIVVGGGLAEAGETLLGPLRTALHDRLTFQREPRLVRAALGDRAGMFGAALLAQARLDQGE